MGNKGDEQLPGLNRKQRVIGAYFKNKQKGMEYDHVKNNIKAEQIPSELNN